MQIVKITDETRVATTGKNGSPYITKTGKPFRIATITFEPAVQGKNMATTMLWDDAGQSKLANHVIVNQEAALVFEMNDKGYLNFKLPNASDMAIGKFEARIKKLEEKVFGAEGSVTTAQAQEAFAEEAPTASDMPWEN